MWQAPWPKTTYWRKGLIWLILWDIIILPFLRETRDLKPRDSCVVSLNWGIVQSRLPYAYICEGLSRLLSDTGGSSPFNGHHSLGNAQASTRELTKKEPPSKTVSTVPPWFLLQVPHFPQIDANLDTVWHFHNHFVRLICYKKDML